MRIGGAVDDSHTGLKGTVVDHDLNERNRGPHNPNPLRYNLVDFDYSLSLTRTSWVEGHAGIVPLDAISQLGDLVIDALLRDPRA